MFTFPGGVHPPHNKELTAGKKIETMPVPARVVIPLSQHTGKPAKPIVKVNDAVKTGQKIAEPDGLISLPVHSSISGTVTEFARLPSPLGIETDSVVIQADGRDEYFKDFHAQGAQKNYIYLSGDEIRAMIREAGIAGLGGAAFPTHVKLNPPENREIDTVIINGCECEPYLTCDHSLMLEYPHELVEGLKIIMCLVKADRGVIAIEDNKKDAIRIVSGIIKREPNVDLAVVKTKYPQGAEKQLIYSILSRKVPAGKLPFEVGVVVDNVGTAVAVKDAVVRGRPLFERVITVTGDGIKEKKNLRVRIGTTFKDVIQYCGGFTAEPAKVISGGPMMGIAQYTLEVPVIKGTSAILVLNSPEKPSAEMPCIRCGRCVDNCPMKLFPYAVYRNTSYGRWAEIKKYDVFDCMECGACSYGCPAGLQLVQAIKISKSRLSAEK